MKGYQYTTVEYSHPDPKYRSCRRVSVQLKTAYGEIVAGASIEVGNLAE